jgi:hypothetical protein
MRFVFFAFCLSVTSIIVLACSATPHCAAAADARVLPPIDKRFSTADGEEQPSFQRHVVNLFGRLGCNGRACHGSFQGQGGLQLSLFGYDFKADHDALFDKDSPRIDLDDPDESLIIAKPTDEDMHEGGKRYDKGSWQYHVLRRWIESGAKLEPQPDVLLRLEVAPAEISFREKDEQIQLTAVAVWEDGSREDVTPLCRFRSNDQQVAQIDETGLVTAGDSGDTHVIVSYDNGVTPVPVLQPVSDRVAGKYPDVPAPTEIDRLVVAKLRKLGIVPSDLCSDTEFLRRVRLDMTGTLPTPQEVEQFLADAAPDKRSRKIDQLLDTPAYAAWWTTKLCDFTGNNDDQLVNATPMRGQAGKEWYDWIYRRVADNMPYDQLAAGIVTARSRRPGQSYLEYCEEMSDLNRSGSDKSFADLPSMTHYWSRRDFREPDARAIAFAYSFMGIRIQCAQCHKHPFDQWSKDDFHQFKNFFAGVVANGRTAAPDGRKQYAQLVQDLGLKDKRGNDLQRELPKLLKQGKTIPFPELYVSTGSGAKPANRTAQKTNTAKLLGGDVVDLADYDDPRTVVMQWLRDKDNRFFARAFANRVWASYFNVGIVHPSDDLSLANPPSNRALLDYLARGFIENDFDMKWLHRQIAGSRTYQLSWQSNETNRADTRNFSHAIPRRLPAEVVYDAIQQATASSERVAQLSADLDGRAIAIPSAGTRYNRAREAAYALTVFGRSTRESNCDCDRSEEASLLQTVYLQNDQDVLQLIDIRKGGWLEELADKLQPQRRSPPATTANAERQAQNLRRQLAAAELRMEKLVKAGSQDAAEQLRRRIAAMQKQLKQLEPPPKPERVVDTAPAVDQQQIVRDAYLRTLSRYPSDTELNTSLQYIAAADDPVTGVRDLLWTLLNTKEFIVNH